MATEQETMNVQQYEAELARVAEEKKQEIANKKAEATRRRRIEDLALAKKDEIDAAEAKSNASPSEEKKETPAPQEKSFFGKMKDVGARAMKDITGLTSEQRAALKEANATANFNAKLANMKGGSSNEETPSDNDSTSTPKKKGGKPKLPKGFGGKGGKKSIDDLLGEMDDDEDGPRSKKKDSPVGVYESAYHHNKPMPYQSAYLPNKPTAYSEAYTARKLPDNGVYKSPGNPRTYDMSRGEPQQQQGPRPAPQPMIQRARAPPMPMPTMGSFNGNIKMPTISLGGSMRNTSAHKMGPSNMPSINIPTLGGSTLMMGSGLMGKTANNKIGAGMFNVPTIGNWGKSTVKSKLNIPSIGGLSIMGTGKKGSVGISLGGEIPRFGLAAPGKRKK